MKVQIFKLSIVPMKVNQIPYVIFQTTSQFSLNIASPFCVMTELLCNVLAQHDIPWIKKSLEVQILRFLSAPVKFTKFLMSFMNPSKFVSVFSTMTHNSSVIFLAQKFIYFGQKEPR